MDELGSLPHCFLVGGCVILGLMKWLLSIWYSLFGPSWFERRLLLNQYLIMSAQSDLAARITAAAAQVQDISAKVDVLLAGSTGISQAVLDAQTNIESELNALAAKVTP